MERLDFSEETTYNAVEASIHLNRYAVTRPFCQGADVLDAACGEGYGSYLMKTWGAQSVTGMDIDASAVDKARESFKADGLAYLQHDVQTLPFEDHVFDVVVSLETLEHLDDAEMFLQEIKRVLRPGGTVILSCPNDNYYYERDHTKNPFHKRTYTFYEFKEFAERKLGSYVEYFLAFALDGFVNLPYERRTEPESSLPEDAFGMFHHTGCDQVLCVPQERYLNQWNSNYFIGIWGNTEKAYRYSAVISPRETFIDHKDADYDLLHHLDEVREEMKQLRRDAEKNSLVSEYEELEKNYEQMKSGREELEKKYVRMKSEQEKLHMELERLKLLLELCQKERDSAQTYMHQNWELYQKTLEILGERESRLDEIRSSRGMKMVEKYYSLRDRVRKMFRK